MNTVLMSKIKYINNLSELSSKDIDLIINECFVDTNNIKKIPSSQMNYEEMKNKCPNCHNIDTIVTDQFGGIIVCKSCGQILEESLFDHNPEWKSYDDDISVGRCGIPTNIMMQQSSLGTNIIGNCNYRLRTLHNWTKIPYKERSLNNVLNIIKKKCEEGEFIGKIADDAKVLYNNAHNSKSRNGKNIIIRKKNRLGLMAACVFYACKRCGYSTSLKNIASLFNISTSHLNKGCKSFAKYVSYMNIDYNTNTTKPSQYIKEFCEKNNFNKKIFNELSSMTKYIEENYNINSHTPISIAAACILAYCTEYKITQITKDQITKSFDISGATLIKAYNKIITYCEYIFKNSLNMIKTNIQPSKIISTSNTIPLFLSHRLNFIKNINIDKYQNITNFKPIKYLNYDFITYAKETIQKYKFYNTKHFIKYVNLLHQCDQHNV